MFEDFSPDIVDICLPTALHRKYTEMAFDANANVICEKPFALDLIDAKAMMGAAKKADRLLMIAHCLRFSREYCYLKELIDKNTLGRLLQLNMYRNTSVPTWSEGNWLGDVSKSGGVPMDLHIHETDMVVYLLGRPDAVTSSGTAMNISTMYHYPQTTVVTSASWNMDKSYPLTGGFDAVFEKGSAIHKDGKITLFDGSGVLKTIDIGAFAKQYNAFSMELSQNVYQNELQYFINCVKNKKEPKLSQPSDSVLSLQVVLAEIESMKSHTTIHI